MGPFELDFHTSCTGVLLRVTGLTKILLNWPVRGSCQVLKFGHQISGRKDGYSIGNLSVSCRQAIGTRIPVPWPNIQKYLNTIKFSDKNIYTGCTGLRRRQDSPTPTRRPSELTLGDPLTFGARVFYCSELRMACSQ